jgi:EpsI family protein
MSANHSIFSRVIILCACLLAGVGLSAYAHKPANAVDRESFSSLPMEVGSWRGQMGADLSDDARDMLRVEDYANRTYVDMNGKTIGFYAGYHPAGGVHSPLNCLPGSGWIPVKKERVDISVMSSLEKPVERTIRVNKIVILKGVDKQVVLYWYQGCGRVIASEYMGLIYGMVDKIRLGRTDTALVRVVSPAASLNPADEEIAGERAANFARQIFPLLNRYIPD